MTRYTENKWQRKRMNSGTLTLEPVHLSSKYNKNLIGKRHTRLTIIYGGIFHNNGGDSF